MNAYRDPTLSMLIPETEVRRIIEEADRMGIPPYQKSDEIARRMSSLVNQKAAQLTTKPNLQPNCQAPGWYDRLPSPIDFDYRYTSFAIPETGTIGPAAGPGSRTITTDNDMSLLVGMILVPIQQAVDLVTTDLTFTLAHITSGRVIWQDVPWKFLCPDVNNGDWDPVAWKQIMYPAQGQQYKLSWNLPTATATANTFRLMTWQSQAPVPVARRPNAC
jgi:hypothetical protein